MRHLRWKLLVAALVLTTSGAAIGEEDGPDVDDILGNVDDKLVGVWEMTYEGVREVLHLRPDGIAIFNLYEEGYPMEAYICRYGVSGGYVAMGESTDFVFSEGEWEEDGFDEDFRHAVPYDITDTTLTFHELNISESTENRPLDLFDFHAHQMPSTFPENWLGELLGAHELKGIVLMGIGDVFTHQTNYPSIVYAFSNFKDVNNIDFAKVESQLESGSRGIGEVSIRHFPAGPPPAVAVENDFNQPDLLRLYDLADQYNVPVNFHFDYHEDHIDAIVKTLPDYSGVRFVWAHAGDAQPEELSPLLAQFDNLYIDISSRNPLESFQGRLLSTDLQRLDEVDGTIKAEWERLFVKHADRVLYGSDIGPKGRLEQYEQIEEYYRGILSQVDADIAEKIARKNAEKLFGEGGSEGDSQGDSQVYTKSNAEILVPDKVALFDGYTSVETHSWGRIKAGLAR